MVLGLRFEFYKLVKSRAARKRVLAKENMMRAKSAGFARLFRTFFRELERYPFLLMLLMQFEWIGIELRRRLAAEPLPGAQSSVVTHLGITSTSDGPKVPEDSIR